jgi:hypothetical protein
MNSQLRLEDTLSPRLISLILLSAVCAESLAGQTRPAVVSGTLVNSVEHISTGVE